MFFLICFCGLIFDLLSSIPAQAQTNLPPPGQDLEAQAERFRKEYSLEKRLREMKKEKPSIEFQEKQVKTVGGKVKFELKEIHISGISVKDQELLSYIWRQQIGTKISMDDLQDIVDHIKRVYKNSGYLTTVVYLPAQDIKGGSVEIKVVEGKLGKLTIEGNKYFSRSSISSRFHADKGDALNFKSIQRDMIRLNENPDLNVKTIIAAGQEPGTTDVTLKVSDRRPYHASIGFDNQGTRLVGRYRETMTLNTSNFSGNHDLMYYTAIHTSLSAGHYLAYRLPVGTRGFKIGMDVGFFEIKLGKEFKPLDITGRTRIYTPNISGEIYRSEDIQANYSAGIKIKDIQKKEHAVKITDEQLRLPYFGMDVTKLDSSGQTTFSPEITFGAPKFLGASSSDNPLASRQGTDGFFFKYEHTINRTQRMPWESYVQIRSQFQAASHTLPSSSQFQLGGESSIRGYPEGDYMADMGGLLKADWVFPMYAFPKGLRLKWSDVELRHQIEPVIFADVGGGRLLKSLQGETESKFLAGIGGGLRIHLKGNSYVKVEWADHVGKKPIRGTGPSTFNISVQMGI